MYDANKAGLDAQSRRLAFLDGTLNELLGDGIELLDNRIAEVRNRLDGHSRTDPANGSDSENRGPSSGEGSDDD